METWNLILLSVSLPLILTYLVGHYSLFSKQGNNSKVPPGPKTLPIVGSLFYLRGSFLDLGPTLRRLADTYGPVITLYIGSQPSVYITDCDVAHRALVDHAAAFAGRPPPLGANHVYSSGGRNISSAAYGPLWRHLRRNLTAGVLHPSHVKSFARARELAVNSLVKNIKSEAIDSGVVTNVGDKIQHATFDLLVTMCFGEEVSEEVAKTVEGVQRELVGMASQIIVFDIWPTAAKLLLWRRWRRFLDIRRKQEEIMIPIIRARREKNIDLDKDGLIITYLDTVLDLDLPSEGGRKLDEGEIVSLCSEFLNGGTDTTWTTLQWIMANLVKNQDAQRRLYNEIAEFASSEGRIEPEETQRMAYLKAVVLEGLRRHPPAPFLLPRATAEEVSLDGHVIPRGALVNFTVAEMGRDGKVWAEPMEFRPERFLVGGEGEGVDVTGSRHIKMMPFGAGRRLCPGYSLALVHLEYFVANLVREFEWKGVEGEQMDLTEKLEFTVAMKNPLRAVVVPRNESSNHSHGKKLLAVWVRKAAAFEVFTGPSTADATVGRRLRPSLSSCSSARYCNVIVGADAVAVDNRLTKENGGWSLEAICDFFLVADSPLLQREVV
ncbi:cytochrome P450 89A2-like [Typha latifolia]|uniref:cytochrome P450 89A2-like n=1 Tax=Typha latifolia TaxID=4733 RepID=UPI003C2B15D2